MASGEDAGGASFFGGSLTGWGSFSVSIRPSPSLLGVYKVRGRRATDGTGKCGIAFGKTPVLPFIISSLFKKSRQDDKILIKGLRSSLRKTDILTEKRLLNRDYGFSGRSIF
ncbi:hypothetical protein SDC9_181319 [bioreactor metagenome]|uniref:Uncharacterized protein n=1 Tax=bioreactor metagenome TaxID=1076179 RepID=A0A645H482_9ZZZZ